MRHCRLLSLVLTTALLCACGDDSASDGRRTGGGVADEQLPTPAGAPGSAVTGMPDSPGPGQAGPALAGPPLADEPVALDEDGNPIPVDGMPIDPGAGSAMAPLPTQEPHAIADTEPSAQEAIALIRDYYAAINARNFAQAFALWSDGGRATGQSPQQFANGFARTNGVSLEVLPPGRIDAAAGARYIEVPVALSTTLDDGSQRKYAGTYTLRRSVAAGASPEQLGWRITSAELREVQP